MEKFKKTFLEIYDATSTRDKVLIVLYLMIFIPLGMLMKMGIIPFPGTVLNWLEDVVNSAGGYTVYIGIFIAMQIANVTTLIGCMVAEDGFVRLIKREYSGLYYGDKLLEMAMSISTGLVALGVNLFMFPMFVPVYIVIGVVLAFMSAK